MFPEQNVRPALNSGQILISVELAGAAAPFSPETQYCPLNIFYSYYRDIYNNLKSTQKVSIHTLAQKYAGCTINFAPCLDPFNGMNFGEALSGSCTDPSNSIP